MSKLQNEKPYIDQHSSDRKKLKWLIVLVCTMGLATTAFAEIAMLFCTGFFPGLFIDGADYFTGDFGCEALMGLILFSSVILFFGFAITAISIAAVFYFYRKEVQHRNSS